MFFFYFAAAANNDDANRPVRFGSFAVSCDEMK